MSVRYRTFKTYLDTCLTEEEIRSVHSSFDLIGDIAIVKIPYDLTNKKYEIADAIISCIPRIRLVTMVTGETSDLYRIRKLEILRGDGSTETVYKESGCSFKLDVSKVFFSPRLSYERGRIAGMTGAKETIINMFSGVGTFSIIIAKKNPDVKVYSIDINSYAYGYMVENVKSNHLENIVIPKLGDAREVIQNEGMVGFADRVLMPLPDTACEFLDIAIPTLKRGGILHYFDTAYLTSSDKKSDLFQGPIEEVGMVAGNMGRSLEIKNKRVLRSVGPRKYHIVIDAKIS
ncbi:MAG: class I SAM-dependent methyltransferase family protein [Halobacteriota archaeon]|nr:class I SAM-dependent methyltransferase family protein [Halobacteriota archaeon]